MEEYLRELREFLRRRRVELSTTQRQEADLIIEDLEWMIIQAGLGTADPHRLGLRLSKIIYRLGSSGILDIQ